MKKSKYQETAPEPVIETETELPVELDTVEFTGKEHWGVGGRFRILENGRRVRINNEKG